MAKIRNSNIGIRNKSEIQMPQCLKQMFGILGFRISNLFRVSAAAGSSAAVRPTVQWRTDFVLRISFLFILLLSPDVHPMARQPHSVETQKVSKPAPEPLTLRDCYRLALERSETVAIRKEDIEQAEANFLQAAGEALGDVGFVATDFFQEPQRTTGTDAGVGGTLTRSRRRERRFEVSQPLFQGFKSIGALMGAGNLRHQRTEEWLRSRQLLFLDVVRAFYNYLRFEKDVESMEGIHQSLEERIADLLNREKIGRSRLSEVVTAKTRARVVEADLAGAHGSLELAGHILEFLIGKKVEPGQLKEEETPTKVERIEEPSQYVDLRPDVEAALQAMKASWRNVIIKQSELWPKITLDLNSYEKREGFQSGIDWDLLFTVNVPIFQGGGAVGNVKQAVSEWKKSKLAYSLTKRQAELEIRQTYREWLTSLERYNALAKAVRDSQENFTLQKDEYARNLVNNLDVLDALQSLFDARRGANQVFYEMNVNYWRFQTAKGECCESF